MTKVSYPTISLLTILCASFATIVLGQINVGQFPAACQSQCQSLLDLAQTCTTEYPTTGNPPPSSACVCTGLANLNYGSCTTCLNSNDQQVGQAVAGLSMYCTQLINGCVFQCGFTTCASSDVGCQCAESYLQDIYNCAACNTAHGNRNATQMSDYTALRDSCINQGYSATPSMTQGIPSPSRTVSYTGATIQASGSITSGSIAPTVSHETSTTSPAMTSSASGLTSTGPTTVSPTTLHGASGRVVMSGVGVLGCAAIILATVMAGMWL